MKKYMALMGLILALMLLGGCTFLQVDELYALPKLPGDYRNLQTKIEEVINIPGTEYSAPTNGSNTQPVQLQDLDGDGELEAIAFFKTQGDEKPLKVYIFRPTAAGYEVGAVVEGPGASIYSITYENLNDSKAKELVISWQSLAAGTNTLGVYSIDRYEVSELLNTPYTAYDLVDINMDNSPEVLVISVDNGEGGHSRVDCYAADKASLVLADTAPLSKGITALENDVTRNGYNVGGETPIPALYVTSTLGEGVVTDIFAWREGRLVNVTLDAETGQSTTTDRPRGKAKPTDINGDTVLDLPIPIGQPGGSLEAPLLDTWYQYDANGNSSVVFTTYQDFTDNWYFVLPDHWVGKVTVMVDAVSATEKRTVFSRWNGEKGEPFLTLYKFTGPNRNTRSRQNERRFTLEADDTTIYCAEFAIGGWNSDLDEAAVKERFKLGQNDGLS